MDSRRAVEGEPLSVEALCERVRAGWAPKYVLFWGHEAKGRELGPECLSQWYPAAFEVEGIRFPTAEHFMMHRKALLFGDDEAAREVLQGDHPGHAKRVGRRVRGFDDETWKGARFEIVVAGSVAKFSQHAELGRFLRGTAPRVLVEASPRDRIWGIGMGAKNADARRPEGWRGLNLLGFALMKARARLLGEDR